MLGIWLEHLWRLRQYEKNDTTTLHPYLLHYFPKPNTFLGGSFSSESNKYPDDSEEYEPCSRVPCHLDDGCCRRIYLKSSSCCRRWSDDVFYERVHDWPTYDDKCETRDSLYYSKCFLTNETPWNDSSEYKKNPNNHTDILYLMCCISLIDTDKWYIHHCMISCKPE